MIIAVEWFLFIAANLHLSYFSVWFEHTTTYLGLELVLLKNIVLHSLPTYFILDPYIIILLMSSATWRQNYAGRIDFRRMLIVKIAAITIGKILTGH